jgi:hypothetical protein
MNKIKLSINETTLELFPIPATDLFLSHYKIYVNGKKTDYELISESSDEDKWITFYNEEGKQVNLWNTDEVDLHIVVSIYNHIFQTLNK